MVGGFVFLISGAVFLGFAFRNGPLRFRSWSHGDGVQQRRGGWDLLVGLLMTAVAFLTFVRHP